VVHADNRHPTSCGNWKRGGDSEKEERARERGREGGDVREGERGGAKGGRHRERELVLVRMRKKRWLIRERRVLFTRWSV